MSKSRRTSVLENYNNIEHLFKAGMSRKDIKELLKAKKLHKYYELVPYIDHKLNGTPLLNLTQRDEERILDHARRIHYIPGVPLKYVLYRVALMVHNDELANIVKPPQNKEHIYEKYNDMFAALSASRR